MTDITKNKHGGNANSKAAFGEIKDELTFGQSWAKGMIAAFGSKDGITIKEISAICGSGANKFSGRLTELKAMGKIKVVGRRDGCAVYEINE